MASDPSYDVAVVGGGLVGMAVGWGLLRQGARVLVLDEGDAALRAARGNFGLIWVQGKGIGLPAYARWTRRSSDLWAVFAQELAQETSIDLQYSRPGGLHFCLSAAEFDEEDRRMRRLSSAPASDFTYGMLDRNAVRARVAGLGEAVVGAVYSPHDGHVNSLRLFRALHAAFRKGGGAYEPNRSVDSLAYEDPGFRLGAAGHVHRAEKVVLAAGHGTGRLAAKVGLRAPLSPERGQILVTAKVRSFLAYPTATVRQTGEGSVLIGDSKEESGFDDRTTPEIVRMLAARAVATFPALRDVPVVRSWGALRIMTPDGYPIYQQSQTCPGAFVACLHSGVTLAAAHAGPLAQSIAAGSLPDSLEAFRAERFDVQEAA